MRFALALLLTTALQAQTPTLPALHISPGGEIVDDSNRPVLLRGLNRSGTGSGNADATATDQDYAAANQLLSMNLVRIMVNATWWTNNVNVPIANLKYQDYIDAVIQRAKRYGNYVLVTKAGQFPDPPCGADGKNCPAVNQGDLNCQATASLCPVQDTSGANTDVAFAFWGPFAKKYQNDPTVLYDTWEEMRVSDTGVWSDGQNQLIAAIRRYNPSALIFVEDAGSAFESIVLGALPDLAWSNIVWNFHIYNASNGTCTEPSSPRYNSWPQNFDPLVRYAQQNGHAVSIAEWGGCNDNEPYHTNIVSYAQAHSIALAYFDSGNLIARSQLTATGTKVRDAYVRIGGIGSGTVASVNAASGGMTLAPEAVALALGVNLAPTSQQPESGFPVTLGGTSVAVKDANGISRLAPLLYVSPIQVDYEIPPGVANGTASVTVTNTGNPIATGTVQIATVAPGIYTAVGDGKGVAAATAERAHANGTRDSALTFQCSAGSCVSVPIDLGVASDLTSLVLYGTGIRGRSSLSAVTCRIGTMTLPVQYAGLQGSSVGLDQVNVNLPQSLRGIGEVDLVLTVDGQAANTMRINVK
jgi:uncharacterized protein (TIGR03437 family)